ncbi:hypothetical protein [Archangium violaceum]|uniref:Uncharacterized protein n=1 Tax=Archangium violaceum Cb vi76 TaxID=1406225 RepID=A0A084SZP9_9BACT|nr:hypothetical protein [Archangium violaceum]KFA93934.1 hypothetical protein Q664_05980 [Archangium violaceum Cb vi76]
MEGVARSLRAGSLCLARDDLSAAPPDRIKRRAPYHISVSTLHRSAERILANEKLITWPILETESKDVAANIRTLASGEFQIKLPAAATTSAA